MNFAAFIDFISKAPRRIRITPTKYITGPTQVDSGKNAPAKSAITGSFAPHGINVQSIAVARRSRSFLIVRHAIIAGTPHPVPITMGITDFPESPTRLKIGSRTTVARAMYPQSSRRAIRKYMIMTRGRNPTTAPTPPIIPSQRIAVTIGSASINLPETNFWNDSINPARSSLSQVPTVD